MKKEDIIIAYYRAMAYKSREVLMDILHPKLIFISSYSKYSTRESMMIDVWPKLGITKAEDVQVFKKNENEYMVKYQIKPEEETIYNAEYILFEKDKIKQIEVYLGFSVDRGSE